MKKTKKKIRRRVKRGVAFLKSKGFNLKNVKIKTLNMEHLENCVLGQTFDNYWDGLEKLDIDRDVAFKFGFSAKPNSPCINSTKINYYPKLNKAWKKQLAKV